MLLYKSCINFFECFYESSDWCWMLVDLGVISAQARVQAPSKGMTVLHFLKVRNTGNPQKNISHSEIKIAHVPYLCM